MPDRKRLLLISHCVPSPVGGADRARAWQLLKLLSRDHSVSLACLFDGPVNLAQWSTVRAQTDRLSVELNQITRRLLSRWLAPIHTPSAGRIDSGQPLGKTVRCWADEEPYDTAVCTDPVLWPYLTGVGVKRSLLDVRSCRHAGRPNNRADAARGVNALDEADILIEGDGGERAHGLEINQRRVQLPDAVDIDQIMEVQGKHLSERGLGRKQRVVYHADWRYPRAQRLYNRFARLIWPEVRRSAPYAELAPSNALPGQALASLNEASLVVNAETEPSTACLPILQAMTLRRTVVAADTAAEALGAKQGEHLMRAGREIDWVMHCVNGLNNAPLRLSLSENARRFVERHRQVNATGGELLRALGVAPAQSPPALSRAA